MTVSNGKGGVGKSAVTANLAVMTAATGRPVVVVDLDPQADLARELGVTGHDDGNSLAGAALGFTTVHQWPTKRAGLTLVAGGQELGTLVGANAAQNDGSSKAMAGMLHRALAAIAAAGVSIFIDTPASTGDVLSDSGLVLGERLLLPTKEDDKSLNGLALTVARLVELKDQGLGRPDIAGVLLFGTDPGATSIRRQTKAKLAERLGEASALFPVLDSEIRFARKAEVHRLELGVSVGEYAELARTTVLPPWYESRGLPPDQRVTFASNADKLHRDYVELAGELGLLDDAEMAEALA